MRLFKQGKYSGGARALSLGLALLASGVVSTGCASGGFKLTRTMARWTNSQMILLRIIIYIVLAPVFFVAELLDLAIFNTIDFWTGTVSARNDVIEKNGERIEIAHTRLPLRRSVITRIAKDGTRTVTELRETAWNSVEVLVDGKRRAELQDVDQALSSLTVFDRSGSVPVAARTIAAEDFAAIASLPIEQGALETLSRLDLQPPGALACR